MENETHRYGFIRVTKPFWLQHQAAIKQNLADGVIDKIHQTLNGGQYMASHDILLTHPEFDEIPVDQQIIPRYICEFFPNSDGTVTRGPMIKEGLKG